MLHTQNFSYKDGATPLEGFFAFDDTRRQKKPLVLVVHDWSGCTDFFKKKAEKLAYLGYAGFAVDMYGAGKTGETNEEKAALMQPLINDRESLFQRIRAAVDAIKKIEVIDTTRIAVTGYCFGGLCALDLARKSTDITAAISLHGALTPPSKKPPAHITTKVLVIHGHDDPLVPAEQVVAFEKEMTEAKADWQLFIYGNTKHAFTNPKANDPAMGLEYNALADRRSAAAIEHFLAEVFTA